MPVWRLEIEDGGDLQGVWPAQLLWGKKTWQVGAVKAWSGRRSRREAKTACRAYRVIWHITWQWLWKDKPRLLFQNFKLHHIRNISLTWFYVWLMCNILILNQTVIFSLWLLYLNLTDLGLFHLTWQQSFSPCHCGNGYICCFRSHWQITYSVVEQWGNVGDVRLD